MPDSVGVDEVLIGAIHVLCSAFVVILELVQAPICEEDRDEMVIN